ncbi:MAG: S41 family peptidase [Planctomycetaceae bacterium]|jgi:carboxyl-terminal processing protease|nr:S41 family peptidase [Planctomycetaceae bacterium]
MPILNIRLTLLFIVICSFCASRTSLREQVLLNAYRKIERLSLRSPSSQDLFEGAMEGMTQKLRKKFNDPYTYFENAENQRDINNQLENKLVGIGVSMEWTREHSVLLYPLPNSPALRAGVQYGDKLLKVEGEETAGLSVSEIGVRIKGDAGKPVVLTVQHPGEEEPVDLRIVRESQQLPTVTGDSLRQDGRWNFTLETNPDIGYVHLRDSFGRETVPELTAALEELNRNRSVKGLILDIRGNPGGYLDSAVDVCRLFLSEGTIVTVKRRDGSVKKTFSAAGDTVLWTKPMVVMVNGESASASEIVAACLQDHYRAFVVGERSYGKGTVQEIFDFPMKLGTLRLTDAEYWRPSGKNINRFAEFTEQDTWGVLPSEGGSVPVSKNQEFLIARIRKLRSLIPEGKREANVEELLKRVEKPGDLFNEAEEPEEDSDAEEKSGKSPVEETKDKPEKSGSQEKKSFVPEGTAPYYDPQLIRAIEVLRKNLT